MFGISIRQVTAFICLTIITVISRTLKDDLDHLYTKNGRVIIGTIIGDLSEVRQGLNEGGYTDTLLEPFFGDMVIKLGKPYIDFPSCPAVHLAINYGTKDHLNVASMMINLGADINKYQLPNMDPTQSDNYLYNRGYPPALMYALGLGQIPSNSHAAVLQRLKRSFPSAFNLTTIDMWRRETGNPPLIHICILLGNSDGAHVLITEFNLSVHATDDYGLTALHVAAWTGNIPAMIMLLQAGADAFRVDSYGRTALHIAALRGHSPAMAKILVTSVDIAARRHCKTVVCLDDHIRKLLNTSDIYDQTAFQLAGAAPVKLALRDYLRAEHDKVNLTTPAATANFTDSSPINSEKGIAGLTDDSWNMGQVAHSPLPEPIQMLLATSRVGAVPHVSAENMTVAHFRTQFFHRQIPVLITGELTSGRGIWAHVQREDFLRRYGNLQLRTGPTAYAVHRHQPLQAVTADAAPAEGGEGRANNASSSHRATTTTGDQSVNPVGGSMSLQEYVQRCLTRTPTSEFTAGLDVEGEAEFSTAAPTTGIDGTADIKDSVCVWPATARTASEQQPVEWRWDLPTPEVFGEVCRIGRHPQTLGDDTTSRDIAGDIAPHSPRGRQEQQRRWPRNGAIESLQLHAGASFTAVPFRSHNASWDLLLTGRKKWYLVAPGAEVGDLLLFPHSNYSENTTQGNNDTHVGPTLPVPWLSELVPKLRNLSTVFELEQNPGEVVFVPHDWHYATVSLANTVSVSQEFCTRLDTDTRIPPVGTVLYGGEDPFRGIGLYKTHIKTSSELGIERPKASKIPVFDFSPIT